ncbi:cell division protein FtsA [Basilea psittacipulmonis]|uniref:Cell division protein FtsA n=1 Tax=Basilea psittacipulmonis DSM 24701 TaxID=1072685 RepID=A0A077DCK0_9BURK|nr:cell division protein FtsA [Basilea psittacipulmonis]AIL32324.1 hypothetical protein IX83_02425 [Basilea psittacipulmonis DSM 24701]
MSYDEKDLIVALDIGTNKVVVMVAQSGPDDQFTILGKGMAHNTGSIRAGVVYNIEETITLIQKAIDEAQLMAACKIHDVYVSIGGTHIQSFDSSGVVVIKNKEVGENDVERVNDTAKAISVGADDEIVHSLIQQYIVDGREGILHPVGMSGMRLEARMHIVVGSFSTIMNVRKCVLRCGVKLNHYYLQSLASSTAVLTKDEKDLGVVMLDIGAGTTDIAVYKNGYIVHTGVLNIAGDVITNDIAAVLGTTKQEAENIKLKYGAAVPTHIEEDDLFELNAIGGSVNYEKRKMLSKIIEARLDELFGLVQKEIGKEILDSVSSYVITGGTALMPGIVELAEDVLSKQVRVGVPLYQNNLADLVNDPRYSTVIGMLQEARTDGSKVLRKTRKQSSVKYWCGRVKSWLLS